MYESFFGLRERPFDLAPNPRFLLLTSTHREALANLQYGLTGRKGLTLLLGEAGSGKTTLIRTALAQWEGGNHLVAHLNNPTLTRDEFIEFLTDSFGLPPAAAASKTRFVAELTALVTERHKQGLITGLLIDEAQSLTSDLLEEVRLLVNIETATDKLFQVILAGQPELAERLNEAGLRQIKQRVALRCTLSTLSVSEVAAYVAGRIQVAGGMAAKVFTREAVLSIHEFSAGIPRVISVICDNAMLAGFAANRRPVTTDIVEEVCRDFDLHRMKSAGDSSLLAETVNARDGRLNTPPPVVSPAPAGTSETVPRPADRPVDEPAAQDSASDEPSENYPARAGRRFSFF